MNPFLGEIHPFPTSESALPFLREWFADKEHVTVVIRVPFSGSNGFHEFQLELQRTTPRPLVHIAKHDPVRGTWIRRVQPTGFNEWAIRAESIETRPVAHMQLENIRHSKLLRRIPARDFQHRAVVQSGEGRYFMKIKSLEAIVSGNKTQDPIRTYHHFLHDEKPLPPALFTKIISAARYGSRIVELYILLDHIFVPRMTVNAVGHSSPAACFCQGVSHERACSIPPAFDLLMALAYLHKHGLKYDLKKTKPSPHIVFYISGSETRAKLCDLRAIHKVTNKSQKLSDRPETDNFVQQIAGWVGISVVAGLVDSRVRWLRALFSDKQAEQTEKDEEALLLSEQKGLSGRSMEDILPFQAGRPNSDRVAWVCENLVKQARRLGYILEPKKIVYGSHVV